MKLAHVLAVALALALPVGGAIAATPATAPAAAPPAATAPAKPTAKSEIIDINRASASELDALPGIGPARAAAIIAGRPYANKRQLVSRKVLTQGDYDRIKDRIIAKQ